LEEGDRVVAGISEDPDARSSIRIGRRR
jgi:hypothetical protein